MAGATLIFDIIAKDKASEKIRQVGDKAEEQGGKFGKLKAAGAVALAGVGAAAVEFGKKSVEAYTDAQTQQSKLSDAYSKFPKLANVSIGSLRKLNEEIQAKTGTDKNQLAAGEAQLAQFGLSGKQIKKLAPLLNDYADKTGKSIPDAAKQLGLAMVGNTRAMKSIGVVMPAAGSAAKALAAAQKVAATAAETLKSKQEKLADLQATIHAKGKPTLEDQIKLKHAQEDVTKAQQNSIAATKHVKDTQKDAAKSGDAYTQVMDGLSKKVGGYADKQATTAAGKTKILKANFTDLEEKVGSKLVPALEKLTDVGVKVTDWLATNPTAMKLVGLGLGIVTAALIAAKLATIDWTASLLLNPIVLIAAAAAVAIAGIVLAVKNWGKITDWLKGVWGKIAGWFDDHVWTPIKTKVSGVIGWFKKNWALVLGFLTGPIGLAVVEIVKHWNTIKSALHDGWTWIDTHVLSPFKKGFGLLKDGAKADIKLLKDAWSGIKDSMHAVWTWVDQHVFSPIKGGVKLVKDGFKTDVGLVKTAWSGLKTSLHSTWTWISKNVFSPFKKGIGAIKTAFSNVKTGIGTVWAGIKAKVASPINFVLGTVYNNGIAKWWNALASKVHLPTLASAKLIKYASGGVLPGYTPGRDVHDFYSPTGGRLALSGGEAIMRPEFTRAVGGASGIARLNMMARSGHFKDGGVLGWAKHTASSAASTAKHAASSVWDGAKAVASFLENPAKAIKAGLTGLVNNLLKNIGGGEFGQIISSFPKSLIGSLASLVPGGGGKSSSKGGAPTTAYGNFPAAVSRWASTGLQALSMAGAPSSLLPLLLHRIGVESGGNPNAINNWDINALRGDPSRGLMQTIGSTFNAYAGPLRGSGIYNPLANIYAAVKYTQSRYGGNYNAAWSGTHGYANGGVIPGLYGGGYVNRGGWAMVGERGAEVVKLPTGSSVHPHGSIPGGVTVYVENPWTGEYVEAKVKTSIANDKPLQARVVKGGTQQLQRVGDPIVRGH